MLTLALGATLVGFVLLILGLITGTVWLAVACIVICLLGLAFLLVDVFASRGRENTRSLEDLVPGATRDDDGDADVYSDDLHADDLHADDLHEDEHPDSGPGPEVVGNASGEEPTRRYQAASAPDEPSPYDPPPFQPGMAAPTGPSGPRPGPAPRRTGSQQPPSGPNPQVRPAPERREGTYEDYLRSVGGAGDLGAASSGPIPGQPPVGRPQSGDRQYGAPPRPPQPGQAGPGGPGPQHLGPPQPGGVPPQPGGVPPQPGGVPPQPPRAGGPGQGAAPGRSGRAEHSDPPSGSRRRPEFDPLDPNWKPPLDD
ncbi:hypothetical protein [Gordonia aurantiaca]|uniref:hypothetical protein n=1 Tax=Gordonia sp. B21 TaxID=3151852 RepID=UPI00326687A4